MVKRSDLCRVGGWEIKHPLAGGGFDNLCFIGVFKRGVSPFSKKILPLSFEGEGDKGGEVEEIISRLFSCFKPAGLLL